MICQRRGEQTWLFTQEDHARLAGQLAAQIGGAHASPLSELAVEAVSLHDAGWPLHDDAPTLAPSGEPLNVFDAPVELAVSLWGESVRRAGRRAPYCQLLVSLHVLWLADWMQRSRQDTLTRVQQFALLQFQHQQIEEQETLRQRLGLSIDLPRQMGLVSHRASPDEDQLRAEFSMLRAMDRVSLDWCLGGGVFDAIDMIHLAPGEEPTTLRLQWTGAAMIVDPWPFARPSLEMNVRYRQVAGGTYSDEQSFQSAYVAAPILHAVMRCQMAPAVASP